LFALLGSAFVHAADINREMGRFHTADPKSNGFEILPVPMNRRSCSEIPTNPDPNVVGIKWLPGNMSRPHFHQHDRFFAVLSGTWWMGTGEKFDPDSTVPAPAGSYVIHRAKGIHYDGAKDQEDDYSGVGHGPATSTPAEKK
jgi:hypothetical protein